MNYSMKYFVGYKREKTAHTCMFLLFEFLMVRKKEK